MREMNFEEIELVSGGEQGPAIPQITINGQFDTGVGGHADFSGNGGSKGGNNGGGEERGQVTTGYGASATIKPVGSAACVANDTGNTLTCSCPTGTQATPIRDNQGIGHGVTIFCVAQK